MIDAAAIIAAARARADLTQEQLGGLVGMARSNIARLERGGRDPSLRVLRQILEACECELRVKVVRVTK